MCVFLLFFARYVERVTRSPAARDLLVVGLGLGTLLYPYGEMFVGPRAGGGAGLRQLHAAVGAAGGRSAADRPRAPSTRRWLGGGLPRRLAVMFEYQAALVAGGAGRLRARALPRARRGLLRGRAARRAVAGPLPHGALRPAVALPLRQRREPRVRAPAHSAGFHGLALPQAGRVRRRPVRARLRPVRVLAGPGAGRWSCASIVVMRGARREGVLVLAVARADVAVPRRHDQLARRLVRRPALHRDGRAVPGVRHRARLALVRARAVAVGARRGLVDAVGGAQRRLGRASTRTTPRVRQPGLRSRRSRCWASGYVPYSLGWLLGLRGLWSLAPLARHRAGRCRCRSAARIRARARWARARGARGGDRRAFLVPLSRYGRAPNPAEARAAAFVRSTWEPPPRR